MFRQKWPSTLDILDFNLCFGICTEYGVSGDWRRRGRRRAPVLEMDKIQQWMAAKAINYFAVFLTSDRFSCKSFLFPFLLPSSSSKAISVLIESGMVLGILSEIKIYTFVRAFERVEFAECWFFFNQIISFHYLLWFLSILCFFFNFSNTL